MLFLTLILSLSSFSQTGTVSSISKDTTRIVLSTEVARKVALDLVKGDRAQEQVLELQKIVDRQSNLILNKDSTITLLEEDIRQRVLISRIDSLSLEQRDADVKALRQSLKKANTVSRIYKFSAFGALVAALGILIFK